MSRKLSVVTLCLVITAFILESRPEARGAIYPVCEELCSNAHDCSDVCEIPVGDFWELKTCLTYDVQAGPTIADTMCDYLTYDTCSVTCDSESSGAEDECTEEGAETTCGDYGYYASCGDGYCSADEAEENSCAADCGDYSGTDGNDVDDMLALIGDMDTAGVFDDQGTTYNGYEMIAMLADAGFVDPIDSDFGCLSLLFSNPIAFAFCMHGVADTDNDSHKSECEKKKEVELKAANALVDKTRQAIKLNFWMGFVCETPKDCVPLDMLDSIYHTELDKAILERDKILNKQCGPSRDVE